MSILSPRRPMGSHGPPRGAPTWSPGPSGPAPPPPAQARGGLGPMGGPNGPIGHWAPMGPIGPDWGSIGDPMCFIGPRWGPSGPHWRPNGAQKSKNPGWRQDLWPGPYSTGCIQRLGAFSGVHATSESRVHSMAGSRVLRWDPGQPRDPADADKSEGALF